MQLVLALQAISSFYTSRCGGIEILRQIWGVGRELEGNEEICISLQCFFGVEIALLCDLSLVLPKEDILTSIVQATCQIEPLYPYFARL